MNTKELEKLEYASNEARIIYHSTPLDSPDIDEAYLAYKNAYNALSYARFFNTDKAYNALSYDRFFNTDKAKQYLESHPGFMSLAGQGVGKSELRKHMANKLKLTQRGNKLNTIEIENLASELIFTHSAEDNTIKKTLEKAVIEETDLESAFLVGIGVRDADFTYAKFRGAYFTGSTFTGTNFRDADLRNAGLRYTDLRVTDCRGVDFRYANLRDTDFTYAKFRGADLRGADLRNAVLRYTDLRGARCCQQQIDSAITDGTTIF